MSEQERACLAALPDTLTVYRGYDRRNRSGWSWTLRGACRVVREAILATPRERSAGRGRRVAKSDIIAYFAERQESEIVVNPGKVRGVRSYAVSSSA